MVGDIKEGISTRYYRQVSNIFTDFLALEPLNGAGGNVTQNPGLEWVSRGFTVMSPCVTVTR